MATLRLRSRQSLKPAPQSDEKPTSLQLTAFLTDWSQLVNLFLLFAVLETAVHSIETARWVTPQPSLTGVLALSIVLALVAARSTVPASVSHVAAVLTGIAVVVWQAAGIMPPAELTVRIAQITSGLQEWWRSATAGEPSQGTIQFVVFLVVFVWSAGYSSAWLLLRKGSPWLGVVLAVTAVSVNLSNLYFEYYIYLLLCLVLSLVFIGFTRLTSRVRAWKAENAAYPRRGVVYSVVSLVCFSIVFVLFGWLMPDFQVRQTGPPLIAGLPWKDEADAFLMNFLARVTSKQPIILSKNQSALYFGDPVDRSDTVVMVVSSKKPLYLRTRIYDLYNSRGWQNRTTVDGTQISAEFSAGGESLSKRTRLTITVTARLRTDVVVSAGRFLMVDQPATVQTLAPLNFDLNLLSSFRDYTLPPDLLNAVRWLRHARSSDQSFGLDDIRQRLPDDVRLKSLGENRLEPTETNLQSLSQFRRVTTLEVARVLPAGGDVVAVSLSRPLNPDNYYTVASDITIANSMELARAGERYPHVVNDYYLQLPVSLPDRVGQLARTVTAGAKTPYEKVVAIKQYLSQFSYRLDSPGPPDGIDGVDYFLFTLQEGECFYFSSTSAVMLRAVGVPSRLVVGYLPGEWDAASGTSIVRARDYHAWLEVYFPGYGWVEFDPTPPTGTTNVPGLALTYGDEIPPEELLGEGEEDTGLLAEAVTEESSALPVGGISTGVLIAVVAGALAYLWRRRLSGLDAASSYYMWMTVVGALARLGPASSDTPLEYAEKLAAVIPAQAGDIRAIGLAYTQVRFSPRKRPDVETAACLRRSWRTLRGELLKRAFLRS